MNKNIKILAIETSCDETAAAVIGVEKNRPIILSNIVSSQVDLHAKTGGVVPEVASRAHMEAILPVIAQALLDAQQEISNSKFLISNQFQNSNDLNIKNSDLNKNLKLINENYPEAINELKNIDYIAVTAGPGLVGSLLVGFNAAKSLAYVLDKPIVAVNHIEGHIYSAFAEQETRYKKQDTNNAQNLDLKKELITDNCELTTMPEFPILALTVSGGHSSLTLMKDHGKYENLGQTLDDAAGEAFDKVAKLLDLGYPGGPAVSKLASQFREIYQLLFINYHSNSNNQIKNEKINEKCEMKNDKSTQSVVFPRPILNDGTFNFSFSGLKTAVLQHVKNIKKERELTEDDKIAICAAFEDAVVDVLTTKAMRAVDKYKPKALILAGGVAANDYLRNELKLKIVNCKLKIDFLLPPKSLCGDNAAMIGLAAFYNIQKNKISAWDKIKVDSNLEL